MSFIDWIKKYWKATLYVTALVVLAVVGVLAFHWEETANKPLWYKAWPWIGGACIAGFFGLIWWLSQSKKKW